MEKLSFTAMIFLVFLHFLKTDDEKNTTFSFMSVLLDGY